LLPFLWKYDFIEAIAELFGQIQGVLIRARKGVYRVEPPGQSSKLAELGENFAGQVELINMADTPDEDHRVRARSDAQGPRRTIQAPLLFEFSIGIKDLNAVVLAVGHIEVRLLVNDDAVRRIELAQCPGRPSI
jgi:hypothetical protein